MAGTPAKSPGKFSEIDSLLLAKVMGADSKIIPGLSHHLFLRHPITDKKLKKEEWIAITTDFCKDSETKRTTDALKKKWDKLIESELPKISNYLLSRHFLGEEPDYEKLSDLTKKVMSAVGVVTPATSMSIVEHSMDPSLVVSPGASSSTTDRKVYHGEPSATKVLDTPKVALNIDQQVDESMPLASCPSPVNPCCSRCKSQRQFEMLQEEKLKQQIKLLKKKNREE